MYLLNLLQIIFITWFTFSIFTIPTSSLVKISNGDKFSEKRSLNVYLDEIFVNLKKNAHELGLEPLKLPDLLEKFNQSFWIFGTLVEVYNLTNGSLYNLESIHRYGDASIAYVNHSLGIDLEVEVDNIKVRYNLDSTFNGHGLWGTLDCKLKLLRIRIAAVMDAKAWNITLQDISFPHPGELDLTIETTKILAWLINSLLKIITSLFESTIINHIQAALKKAIEDYLKHFPPKMYR